MKRFFLFALVATMFAACVTDETQDVAVELAPETLTVSFEDADSRIQLQNGKTVWTKGDLVSVFYRSNANQKWQYQGETGERTGDLKQVAAGSATATMPRVVIVYPYSDSYYLNHETYNIEASLPVTQSYMKDSYGVGGNIMVSSGEYNQFALKSVCGWLKIQLTGNGEKVKSIKLRGNNGEQVAGQLYVNSTTATAILASEKGSLDDGENSAGGNLVFDNTILTEVTLDCGAGVTLGAEATAFYIGLPPQTFERGLTVEIECPLYTKAIKSTNNTITIQRNAIQPMSAFEFDGERIQQNNEIWYTATEKIEPSNVFGANIVSNEWDSQDQKGIITFDSNVTRIGNNAFRQCSNLTSVTIPNGVTRIGSHAFNLCSSLTSIMIPDSVTEINERAFSSCSSLTNITIPNSVTDIGEGAFAYCRSLKAFYGKFASENNSCLIIDGRLISFAAGSDIIEYIIPDSVTEIGVCAFSCCSNLTSVTIPNSVTSIKTQAFYKGENLVSIAIPDSVTSIGDEAFYSCNNLTSITIPDSVTSIGEMAFQYCENLTSVIIGNSVSSIGKFALRGCSSLKYIYCRPVIPPKIAEYMFHNLASDKNIYVPYESVEAYKTAEFWNEYTDAIIAYDFDKGEIVDTTPETWKIYYTATEKVEPYNTDAFGVNILSNKWDSATGEGVIAFDGEVTEIGEDAFHYCSSLTSITIGNSVTSIGRSAFERCLSLTSVAICNSVTLIGGYAFSDCSSLTSITIPDSVTEICERAFRRCSSLTSVTIPDNVTDIGESAFYNCGSLKAFYGKFASVDNHCLIVNGKLRSFAIGCGLTEYTIPDSVTLIGWGAFAHCGSLTRITIPNSVTKIRGEVFSRCSNLASVTIGDNVTTIGDNAFLDCGSLTSITIPDSVISIGKNAFLDCNSLKDVYCKPTTPPTGGIYMFSGYYNDYYYPLRCNIYVPRGSVDAYKAAEYWRDYADYITTVAGSDGGAYVPGFGSENDELTY